MSGWSGCRCHREPIKYRDRDPGVRPSRQEDPFNAIVRRCTLKGAASGKLAGKRFGLKNNICVAGMPMTCASLLLEGYIPETDATIVTRLLDAGAEVVATLNLDNFAFSGAGDTSALGPVLNPHNTDYLAGGSSGGSAAGLYYDDIDITIGGDQGGSIRIPASWCGVVGLKPTHGLVPYTGIVGIDNTFDHAGPMSRTVADSALTLEVIAGKDPLDPRQGDVPTQEYTGALGQSVDGLRIGVLSEGFGLKESDPDVDEAVRKALAVLSELGVQTTQVSVPDHVDAGGIVWGLVAEGATALLRSNGMGHHWEGLYNPGLVETLGRARKAQANDLPPTVKLVLLMGSYVAERYHGRLYAKAQNLPPCPAGRLRPGFTGSGRTGDAHDTNDGPSLRDRHRHRGLAYPRLGYAQQHRALQHDRPPGDKHPLRQGQRPAGGADAGGKAVRRRHPLPGGPRLRAAH